MKKHEDKPYHNHYRRSHPGPRPKRAFGYLGNPDNVIPADRPPTIDEIIDGYGRAQMRLDPLSNREFAIVMTVLDFIRDYLGLKELTNEVVALAIQMTVRGLHNRKIIIIRQRNELTQPPTGSKLPPQENL